jgi:AraC-like DNA-binding protein
MRTPHAPHRTGSNLSAFARYLPVEPEALAWGLHIIDAGFTDIPAGSPYPPGRHPDGYMFTWEQGRVLREYQLVYITRGSGTFESREARRVRIEAGDLFLLLPGAWHRYRPDKAIGWDENWVGFSGVYAEQIMARFFPANQPVLHVGHDEELLGLIRSVSHLMQTAPPGYRAMMAGNTTAALARARGLAMLAHAPTRYEERKMHEARCFLLEHAAEHVDLPALAKRLGYSYSRFRSLFRTDTGLSPRQYQLQIRINRANDLLSCSDQTVSQIADRLGFCSVYYFSRMFRERTGRRPSDVGRPGGGNPVDPTISPVNTA